MRKPIRKERPVSKGALAGMVLEQETCLLTLDDNGALYLAHVQAEVIDRATGRYVGTLLMNDEVRLPLSRFEFVGRPEE